MTMVCWLVQQELTKKQKNTFQILNWLLLWEMVDIHDVQIEKFHPFLGLNNWIENIGNYIIVYRIKLVDTVSKFST